MDEIVYIYALLDPNTDEVRYVGKTNDIERRYREHLNIKKHPKSNHKNCWVKSLMNQGLKPSIIVLEESTNNNWQEREKYWITVYSNLTNGTTGGDGGFVMSEEALLKMKERNTGINNPMWGKKWNEEQRKKLSEQRKGVPKTEEWKNKVSSTLGHQCTVDGVTYRSLAHAQKELGIFYRDLKKLLNK